MSNTTSNVNITVLEIDDPTVSISRKSRLGTCIKHFPLFIIGWSAILLGVYRYYDKEQFGYNCRNHMSYKIISYQLNHDDADHLITNIIMLLFFGAYTCIFYTDLYTLAVFQAGIVAGGIGFYIDCKFNSHLMMIVGSSAGVCSLIGAILVSTSTLLLKERKFIAHGIDITKRPLYILHIVYILGAISVLLKDIIDMIQSWITHGFETTSYSSHFSGYTMGAIIGILREII